MKPSKLPEESWGNKGIDLVKEKINEMIEYLPEKGVNAGWGDEEICTHPDTYKFGVMTKCKACKQMWKADQ